MKSFRTFITEGKYPMWVRITVGALVLRIRSLSARIENETDPVKQNKLIAQQNKLLSYREVDLSRFSAAPGARLSHLSFERDWAFPAQC